jgi:homoserine O-succinyltransferase/O-acetyltransferase
MSALPPASPDRRNFDLPTDDTIVVGLVNCMSDAARRTTERQFRDLLVAATFGRCIELRLLSLPGPANGGHGNACDAAEANELDGVIVTGVEPRAASLPQEPCWSALTRIADWAEETGTPTIWSCLAAHAAVRHLSGVDRRLRAEKLSGLFECNKAIDHRLLAGLPSSWRVPHSRCNELDEATLMLRGYRIVSRSAEAGADMFIRQGNGLALFMHGHPEYERQTLLMEYRRDIGRFLAGERDSYPGMPVHYFDERAAAALAAFRETALRTRRTELLADFPVSESAAGLTQPWREPAVRLYANWLTYLADRKSSRRSSALRPPGALAPGAQAMGALAMADNELWNS